jgi:hypothetical protein
MVALAAFLLCAPALAGSYALAGFGPAAETSANGGSDPTVPAWIGAGYRSGPWAAEVTYASLGEVKRIVSTGTSTLSERDWTGKGFGAFGVRYFGPFLARAGVYRLHSESTVPVAGPGDLGEPRSEMIWAPSLGFGWEGPLGSFTGRLTVEYVHGSGDFKSSSIGGFSLLYGF